MLLKVCFYILNKFIILASEVAITYPDLLYNNFSKLSTSFKQEPNSSNDNFTNEVVRNIEIRQTGEPFDSTQSNA